MKVEYSNRVLTDLKEISAASRAYGDQIAAAVEARIREIILHIAAHPGAAPQVEQRPGVHVVPLVRYPYKLLQGLLKSRVHPAHPPYLSAALDIWSLIMQKTFPPDGPLTSGEVWKFF